MTKEHRPSRENRKQAAMTLKEKRAAKRAKKMASKGYHAG